MNPEKSQESQEKPRRNTNTMSWPRNQLYRWQFTLEADKPDSYTPEELWRILKEHCKEFYFQLEKGDKGYLHYQGVLSLKSKEYMEGVKNIIGMKSIHLEPVQNLKKLENYCKKEDTRVAGPWSIQSQWIKTITSFREWQKDLLDRLLKEPDDRSIIWYCDPKGSAGKTQMAKYLAVHKNAIVLNNAKTSDIAYALPDNPHIVIFDLARSNEGRINYGAIEQVKNGLVFSAKYESKMKYFNSPHVIVFSNNEPDYEQMSKDRWEVVHLSKKDKVEED